MPFDCSSKVDSNFCGLISHAFAATVIKVSRFRSSHAFSATVIKVSRFRRSSPGLINPRKRSAQRPTVNGYRGQITSLHAQEFFDLKSVTGLYKIGCENRKNKIFVREKIEFFLIFK